MSAKCPSCGSTNIKRTADWIRKELLIHDGAAPTHYCVDCRAALVSPSENYSVPMTPDDIEDYFNGGHPAEQVAFAVREIRNRYDGLRHAASDEDEISQLYKDENHELDQLISDDPD